ncbi:MAG TPA: histidine kinase [Terriglobia bacterium]|nr:histidine kinase [Terriglobia bacterium]
MRAAKLRTKIILFTALLIVLVISGSFFLVNRVVKGQIRTRLVRDLERSQLTLEQTQTNRLRELVAYSIIASENSTLKAAVDTYQTEMSSSSPVLLQLQRTVENEAGKLIQILSSIDLLIITSNSGDVITVQGIPARVVPKNLSLSSQPSVINSLSANPLGYEKAASLWQFRDKVYRIVSVPILLQDNIIGTLSSGFEISANLVRSMKSNTNSEIVFYAESGIIASTLSSAQNQALLDSLKTGGSQESLPSSAQQSELSLNGETFLSLRVALGGSSSGHFMILNSIDQAMQGIMGGIKQSMVLTALFSVILATLLGWGLSQSFTHPLINFVEFMDGITQTGDLSKKFRSPSPNYEVDVLARSFESMAHSLEESQAESARYHEELRQNQFNEEKLRTLAMRSRLDALISQVNPHFLFNALNTVGVMIDENPVEAQRLTVKLANIFRRTLQVSEKEIISLQEELNFIADYLEIEKARFGERLQVEQRVQVQNAKIPCFTLQPLIENAIKHGAAPKIGTTTIQIDVTQWNGRLTIRVTDNGVGIPRPKLDSILERGYGLRNLIDRLTIHYRSDFTWKVESEFQQGTTILLELPSQPPDYPAPAAA